MYLCISIIYNNNKFLKGSGDDIFTYDVRTQSTTGITYNLIKMNHGYESRLFGELRKHKKEAQPRTKWEFLALQSVVGIGNPS